MINSVPALQPESHFKNTIKIDNYEGRRFKTQTGYEPTLTSSRYEGFTTNERERDRDMRMHSSQEEFKFEKENKNWQNQKRTRY